MENEEYLGQAIQLIRAGRPVEARSLLIRILRVDPGDERAWSWYVHTFPDPEGRVQALGQFLKIHPGNQSAQKALLSLLDAQIPRWKNQTGTPARRPVRTPWLAVLLIAALCIVGLSAIFGISSLARSELLEVQVNRLQDSLADLQQVHLGLENRYSELNARYESLQGNYQTLMNEFEALKERAVVAPYISIANREVMLAFLETDLTERHWTVSFDVLESELRRGNVARDSIQRDDSMWRRLSNTTTGETYRVVDMGRFVDPSAFSTVAGALYAEAESDEAFIREVWNIVTQLATYSREITETPRYPLETFLAGGGDCEDTAILFASIVSAAPVNWDVQLVYMDIDNPTNPQDVDHVVVFVDTGQEQHLVETTWDQEMEPYPTVTGWYVDVP